MKAWLVALKTAPSLLDATSSGQTIRKFASSSFIRKMSAMYSPRCSSALALSAPAAVTATACFSSSGRLSGLRSLPPFTCGFAPMRRSPVGHASRISLIGAPLSSNSSSGRYERSHSSSALRCASSDFAAAAGTWCEFALPSTATPPSSLIPVQPLSERTMIIGQVGRSGRSPPRQAA